MYPRLWIILHYQEKVTFLPQFFPSSPWCMTLSHSNICFNCISSHSTGLWSSCTWGMNLFWVNLREASGSEDGRHLSSRPVAHPHCLLCTGLSCWKTVLLCCGHMHAPSSLPLSYFHVSVWNSSKVQSRAWHCSASDHDMSERETSAPCQGPCISVWAAVTKYYKLGGLSNRKLLSPSSGGPKSTVKVSAGGCFWGWDGESAPAARPAPGGLLVICDIPWFLDGSLWLLPSYSHAYPCAHVSLGSKFSFFIRTSVILD